MHAEKHQIRPGQSEALLKELHILTRDGKLNQDSRRKLKQIYHLYQFIEPLLEQCLVDKTATNAPISLVDHGAGKSYLGFILYDLFFKPRLNAGQHVGEIFGVENRPELVSKAAQLAQDFGFKGMHFLCENVAQSTQSKQLPARVDIVTALHACDTATDDAIRFGIEKDARFMVLVPCCQAEVAANLRSKKSNATMQHPFAELWRHPLHTREFGSQLTNVLRGLQLQAHGYKVTVTELVGWEHSMKNELIIATKQSHAAQSKSALESIHRLQALLHETGLDAMQTRFFTSLT